jgi:hypothetical protein
MRVRLGSDASHDRGGNLDDGIPRLAPASRRTLDQQSGPWCSTRSNQTLSARALNSVGRGRICSIFSSLVRNDTSAKWWAPSFQASFYLRKRFAPLCPHPKSAYRPAATAGRPGPAGPHARCTPPAPDEPPSPFVIAANGKRGETGMDTRSQVNREI